MKPKQRPLVPALMGSAFLFPSVLKVQLPGWNREVAGQEISSMAPLVEGPVPKGAGLTVVWGIWRQLRLINCAPRSAIQGKEDGHLQG